MQVNICLRTINNISFNPAIGGAHNVKARNNVNVYHNVAPGRSARIIRNQEYSRVTRRQTKSKIDFRRKILPEYSCRTSFCWTSPVPDHCYSGEFSKASGIHAGKLIKSQLIFKQAHLDPRTSFENGEANIDRWNK